MAHKPRTLSASGETQARHGETPPGTPGGPRAEGCTMRTSAQSEHQQLRAAGNMNLTLRPRNHSSWCCPGVIGKGMSKDGLWVPTFKTSQISTVKGSLGLMMLLDKMDSETGWTPVLRHTTPQQRGSPLNEQATL